MSTRSAVFRILVAIGAALVIAGVLAGVIYFILGASATGGGGQPIPIPPIPGQETTNMFFVNALTKPIIIIPIYGSATDNHSPHWTAWPQVPGQADPNVVLIPRSEDLTYKEVLPGETWSYDVLTAGMASAGFIIRVDCDPVSRICELGDSIFIPGLDGPTPNDLYRDKVIGPSGPIGQVPFKPAIDTRVEFTWGCAYADRTLCGVNPSCITKPGEPGCAGLPQLMSANPTAKFSTNGLLYKPDGSGGFTNIPLPANTVSLIPDCFFDISCVDGFTVPMILQARRPATAGFAGSSCHLRDGVVIDAPVGTWQTLASTAHLADLTQCPTDEVLWPGPRVVASVAGLSGDGYNEHSGVQQFDMPWVTQATSGAPAGTKLLGTFGPGAASQTDLRQFRNPKDLLGAPGKGWSISNIVGCSSPCAVLTQNRAVSQMYPKTGGFYSTPSYIPLGADPFEATARGVSEVCCKPAAGSVVSDSNLQCNTSIWWTQPPGIGPADPTVVNVQYNFGFYVNDYAPSPGDNQPWWEPSPSPGHSINPYASGAKLEYVDTVRNHQSGQSALTGRAYSYAHDDAWNTIVCGTVSPLNEQMSDGRGVYYNRYDMRVIIGTTVP